MTMREGKPLLPDFDDGPRELVVYGVAGEIRHRQVPFPPVREIDMPRLPLESGIYFAVAKSAGREIASGNISLVR